MAMGTLYFSVTVQMFHQKSFKAKPECIKGVLNFFLALLYSGIPFN